jgi:hypothetical protein
VTLRVLGGKSGNDLARNGKMWQRMAMPAAKTARVRGEIWDISHLLWTDSSSFAAAPA